MVNSTGKKNSLSHILAFYFWGTFIMHVVLFSWWVDPNWFTMFISLVASVFLTEISGEGFDHS